MGFEEYVFCFFVYSFLGYVCEVVYCSIAQRKFVNRGYLYMPICPIYGYGAIIILLTMQPIAKYWYLVLILGIILTSALEYLTSYLMELIFKMRWWDYSNRKFNIKGRICLRNSLMFGALVMIVIYVIQPLLTNWIKAIPPLTLRIIDYVLLGLLVVDTIFSTIKNINISKIVSKLQHLAEEASHEFAETKERLLERLREFGAKHPNLSLRKIGKKLESFEEFLKRHSHTIKSHKRIEDGDNS